MRRDLEKLVAQHVFAEYCTCAEDWIPWKKILSEEGAASLKGRRSGDAKDCFLEALAFGAGFCENHQQPPFKCKTFCRSEPMHTAWWARVI